MILDEIIASKKDSLPKTGKFIEIIKNSDVPAIICELKLKSPTHLELFTDDYQEVLDDYKNADIKLMSVVTDKAYFGGDFAMVREARSKGFVVLRKDFVTEPSQVAEVYSDALLLIARILTPEKLSQLVGACNAVGIEPVVEIHSDDELQVAYNTGTRVIAVNTRDLDKQQIDFEKGLELLSKIDASYTKLLFSGIDSRMQVQQAKQSGADGVLIGTSVLSASDRVAKISEIRGDND